MSDVTPQEMEVLAEAGRLLPSTLDLAEVLVRLANIARTRLETDVARIWLLDEPGEVLRLPAHNGRGRPPLPAPAQVATRPPPGGRGFPHRKPPRPPRVPPHRRLEERGSGN